MLNIYYNKQDKRYLLVDDMDIVKKVLIERMLLVPMRFFSIYDENIVFIEEEVFDFDEMKGYIFLADEDLTNNLKLFYKDYYSNPSYFKELAPEVLNDLRRCIEEKGIKHSCFIPRLLYNGKTLYDPETPVSDEKWKLLGKFKI